MAQDKKALLAVILAVKRGFVSPEEGMNLLEQADADEAAAATVFDQVPHSQVEELRRDATVLAQDPEEAEKLLAEAGVPPEVQQTLLNLSTGKPAEKEEIEATLLSLSPKRATTIIERPKLKTAGNERYQLLREHARGGMGRIMVAVDKVVGREVALKELLPFKSGSGSGTPGSGQGTPASNTTAAAARFLREATVTGQLEHPNIVPVYEIGQRDDGSLYYTMKYVKGRTLASRLRAIRTDVDLSPEQKQAERMKLLDAFVDICNAIAFAHSRGVIHRDIKPANIMLGDFGEALVLDWGLARVRGGDNTAVAAKIDHEAAPDLTMEGEVMGTPAYMPPEQAAGKLDMVDERSDIYSLGAVLYEIVTGEAPYQGKTAKQVLSSVLSEEPRRIPDVSPDAPPELAALVMRALQRNPDDRFQSARDLADEVQAFRDGRMVSTYRYSAIELLTRFVARNRAAVAVTVLALLVLVAGGVYAYGNVKRERDSALAAQADALAQRGIAENQAREAERQKGIAQDQALEAERQKGIAKERADDAEAQKRVAVQKATEAELERKRADDKAAEAAAKAEEARVSEERASRALEQARRNLAQAHLGYAQLADERGQTGEHVLHLAAAHSADAGVVDSTRLVSALNDGAFPAWSTRSYVDLPAGPAVFSPDRRLCAAAMHKPPKLAEEFMGNADSTALPDIGIWDVASGTLLRRISVSAYQQRSLLFNGDGTRLVALEEGGTLRIWNVEDGNEITSRAAHSWGGPPLLAAGHDDDTFFTAGQDGKVWEWHLSDGSAARSWEMKDTAFSALAVSSDGKLLACGKDNGVLLWEIGGDAPPREIAVQGYVNALLFAPDGLLVSTADGGVALCELSEGNTLRTFTTGGWTAPTLDLSPDGTRLLVGLFEQGWKLFDYATAEVLHQQGGKSGRVLAATFSPDGQNWLVALKGEGFDAFGPDGNSLVSRGVDHLLGSISVEFSPDGSLFASGDYGGRLLLRRVVDSATIWNAQVTQGNIFRVAFSPDGTTLAVCTSDPSLLLLDTSTGDVKQRLGLNTLANCVKFSPDGRYLFAPLRDGPARLLDIRTGNMERQFTLDNQQGVIAAAFDPSAERMWLLDQMLNQWSWEYKKTGPPVITGRIGLEKAQLVYGSAISPDGKLIVMALADGSITAWEPEPVNQRWYLKVGTGPIITCAFGTSSSFVVCGDGDGMLNYIDTRQGKVVLRRRAHRAAVAATAVSPNGRDIITSSVDGEFRAWEAHPMLAPERHKLGVSSLSNVLVAPDGRLAAAVTDSGMVRLFEVAGGVVMAETDVFPHYLNDIAFSPDGSLLAIAHSGGAVKIWQLTGERQSREIAVYDDVQSVCFDAQGRLLLTGAYRGLQMRDAASGELLKQHPAQGDHSGLLVFPDGKRVLQTGGYAEARILEIDSGRLLATLERGSYYSHANAISPDGTVVALMRDRGLIGIYDAETGERLRTLKVRPEYISAVHFLPDGRRLFYLMESGGAAVVDVASGQELTSTFLGYSYASRASLAPDGSFALIGSSGGEVEVWRIAPALSRQQQLSKLDVETLVSLAQLRSELKLDNLTPVPMPRQTGGMTWLAEDRLPPAFLRGSMPAWVPRLEGTAVDRAREFIEDGATLRRRRLDDSARAWIDGFEGFRYRDEIGPDLSVQRIVLPPRERDERGAYIGEPQGQVDFLRWLDTRRGQQAAERKAQVEQRVSLAEAAANSGNWRVASSWYGLAVTIDPGRTDLLIPYANVCLRTGETWNITWRLSEQVEKADPGLRPQLRLAWARCMAFEWDYQGMLARFDAARAEGYKADDWHLYRIEAMETAGAYQEAVNAATLALPGVTDPVTRAGIMAAMNRCTIWLDMQKKFTELPKVIVLDAPEGSNAALAGLRAGDVIVGFDIDEQDVFGGYWAEAESLRSGWERFLAVADPARQQVGMTVMRDGKELVIEYPRKALDATLFTLKPRPE
ncbi:MAG: Serine/threonine-protein kinase PknD [Planctomycetes bacterium]|nr:Serine/threonine-protein kinase PknD [Planctomycetota bacterium]